MKIIKLVNAFFVAKNLILVLSLYNQYKYLESNKFKIM